MAQTIIGKVIQKRYRVESFIASGAMKTVYKVRDLDRSVPLALKMLHGDLEEDPVVLKSFRRDAKAIEELGHPNIVRFYGLGQAGKMMFMLEEYIDGPSLKEILKGRKRLTVEEALVYLRAMSAALGYAHNKGIVHCDVKPGNVMVNRGGEIKLTDFGIARHAGSDSTSTLAGAGTPGYMAPEQVLEKEVTAGTDIYALGVMLYEMLTGQRPFRGTESGSERGGNTQNERIRYAHVKLAAPDPRVLNRGLSTEVAEVVLKALAKDPRERYRSTLEFYETACRAAGVAVEGVPDRAPQSHVKVGGVDDGREDGEGEGENTGEDEGKKPKPKWLVMWGRVWPQNAPYLGLGVVVLGIAAFFIFGPGPGGDPPPPTNQPRPTVSITNPPDLTAFEPKAAGPTSTPMIPPTIEVQDTPSSQPTQISPVSSNSSEFVFAYGPTNDSDIYVGSINAGNMIKLSGRSCHEAEPSLSADGNWAVFQENCSGNFNLQAVEITRGDLIQLTNSADVDEREPDWSPDGSRLVFRANPSGDTSVIGRLHVLNFPTGRDEELPVSGKGPAWSPDGEKIAYMSNQTGTWQIFVYEISNGKSYQVTHGDTQCRWPAWSPDGKFLVYNSANGSDLDPSGIWKISISGGDPEEIIPVGPHGRPSWSGSEWILFNTSNTGIQAIRKDGTDVKIVIADSAAWAPDW